MKISLTSLLSTVFACAVFLPGMRADSPASAPKMSSYRPAGPTLAQSLVDQLPKTYPEVQCAAIHALLPNGTDHATIASCKPDEVGALDDDFDVGVEERQNMYVKPLVKENSARTIIKLPVKDATGKMLNAEWDIYFRSPPTADQVKLLTSAMAIRDDMAAKISGLSALFGPPAQ
jgi:hypothetical protein